MANITKVPNGPLIKKKGPFKGSTLKSGGAIKKAQNGVITPAQRDSIRGAREKEKATRMAARADKEKKSSAFWKKQDSTFVSEAEKRGLTREQYSRQLEKQQRQPDAQLDGMEGTGKKRNNNPPPCKGGKCTGLNRSKTGSTIKKAKAGGMIKRADGSFSKRGLWDNLRSKAAQNKKTGAKPKSPTKAMLTQEKKIKAKK